MFHWHPMISSQGAERNYHQRPHFHVKRAGRNFGKVHLVSTLAVDPNSQKSVAYLDQLIEDAIALMADELLDRELI